MNSFKFQTKATGTKGWCIVAYRLDPSSLLTLAEVSGTKMSRNALFSRRLRTPDAPSLAEELADPLQFSAKACAYYHGYVMEVLEN